MTNLYGFAIFKILIPKELMKRSMLAKEKSALKLHSLVIPLHKIV
ncbi:MAG: hypothetical protein ACJAYB_001304 [Psychromonas sp.]|jgi:hypothetical protein